MTLISCPECKRSNVSSRASICPDCGHPVEGEGMMRRRVATMRSAVYWGSVVVSGLSGFCALWLWWLVENSTIWWLYEEHRLNGPPWLHHVLENRYQLAWVGVSIAVASSLAGMVLDYMIWARNHEHSGPSWNPRWFR